MSAVKQLGCHPKNVKIHLRRPSQVLTKENIRMLHAFGPTAEEVRTLTYRE
jgi:hypothetical protein